MKLLDRTTRQGSVVGLIAYAAVAVFYAAFDFLAMRGPLYTVNMLGRSLFRGMRDSGVLQYPTRLDATAIVWYNAFHLLAAVTIGLVVMHLVDRVERRPSQAPVVLLVLLSGFVATVVAVGFLTVPIRPLLPWWSIVVANSLAVVAAAVYVTKRRPGVAGRLLAFGREKSRRAGTGPDPSRLGRAE